MWILNKHAYLDLLGIIYDYSVHMERKVQNSKTTYWKKATRNVSLQNKKEQKELVTVTVTSRIIPFVLGNHYKPLIVTRILSGDISNLPRVHHAIFWCKNTNTKWLRTTISVTCWIILSSPPASLRPKFLEKIVTTAIVCLLAGLMFHFDLAGVHWTGHKGTKGFQIMTGFWLERPVWYIWLLFQDQICITKTLDFGYPEKMIV